MNIGKSPSILLTRLKITTFFLSSILFCFNGYSQFERFKTYDVSNGICHAFVYTINQDKNGFIWFGTGEGLCRFDGFEFVSFSNIDTLSNEVAGTSFKDSFGNLWFGFSNGLILSWNGEKFQKYILPVENSANITSISQNNTGEIFITTQSNGCFTISSKGKVKSSDEEFKGKLISSAVFTEDALILGCSDGLEIIPIKNGKFIFDKIIYSTELQDINVQVIRPYNAPGIFLIGTEDSGLYLLQLKDGNISLSSIGAETQIGFQNIQDIYVSEDNTVWICTYYTDLLKTTDSKDYSGLFKITGLKENGSYTSLNGFKEPSGLSSKYVKSVFFDREGNIWIGTYGNGVALLAEQAFLFMSFENYIKDNNILSVATNDSIVWLGGENGLLQANLKQPEKNKLFSTTNGLPYDKITALCFSKGLLWIGFQNSGIYQLNCKTGGIKPFYKSGNSIGNSINYLKIENNTLFAATKDGIVNIDILTGQNYQYRTQDGLPHNDIKHIFIDKQEQLLFATRANGIFEINGQGEVQEYFTVGKFALEFNSITQDVKGNVWVSTYGQGIFLLLADTIINFTAQDGLKSNYCYGITTADSNYVWIGHRLGLSRINIDDYSIKTFDIDIGIKGDCNINSFASNKLGLLFFGTTDGLVIYNTHKGKEKLISPKTNIIRVLINDKEVDFHKPIVLPYSPYKLRIEFIGLCYNDPKEVKYQYKLQGYDMDWSEISDQRYVIYSRVEDGEFKFQLRSFGHDVQSYDEIPGFIIRIKPPIWKRWWFILLMVLLIVFIIIAIIKYRERQQKAIQEFLEKSLDERTREVVEQKEEIEIKNRDITDSINYAQRIQNSILPPIKKLQQNFSGSFIFYQPRDIVSGDFYWFDKVTKDKFIIVCADSTGHGVPGAFMSMIGTTLIKDICLSQKLNTPADILRELDSQLSGTLNQNIDEAKSNDGMDIMICEIDTSTNHMRCASAMRPMIIYRNGEQVYVKGSRSSIGGQYDSKDEKNFEHEEYQLSKGDLIYMFSDGYPDQFGGPLGKKFKMVRLKNLIKDIHKKPMEEQYEYVKSTFNLWREDYEQVDDVLFMGIKI